MRQTLQTGLEMDDLTHQAQSQVLIPGQIGALEPISLHTSRLATP
jgi:hypothetical protein